MCTVLCDLGIDQENIFTDINSVHDRLLARVFADNILVKISKGAFVGRSGQTDNEGIKIGQHLAPHVINGAVALVHDDTVEKLRRIFCVIYNLFSRLFVGGFQLRKIDFLCALVQFLTAQDRIHTLNGADADLHITRDIGAFETANAV